MAEEQFTKVLDKLVDSFDDFKERLIRIEENLKDVKNVKNDVEDLKIQLASLNSKTSSAHERIDTTEKEQNARIEKIEGHLTKAVWTVLSFVILGVLGAVLVF